MTEMLQYPGSASNHQDDEPELAKRPKYESQSCGVPVGYATPTSQHQSPQPVTVTIM